MPGSNGLSFVTQGDELFSLPLRCLASTVGRHHPEATLYVYDGGLTNETRAELAAADVVEIVDWRDEASYDPGATERWRLRAEDAIQANQALRHVIEKRIGYGFLATRRRKDFYMQLKQATMLDCANRVDGPLVWIDSDAVLLDRLDEVLDADFDVGITSRPKIESAHMNRHLDTADSYDLNAGVVVFNCSPSTARDFVEAWIDEIDALPLTTDREQTALVNLCRRTETDVFGAFHDTAEIDLGGATATLCNLPGPVYNHTNLQSGIDPDDQKILHFKGRRFEIEPYRSMIEAVADGDVSDYTRHPTA